MPKITIETQINAPICRCFDLARSIDLHAISTVGSKEKAIDGRTKGLIELDECVTWEATHFGVRQQLTTKISAFTFPNYFVDEQLSGAFKSIYHQHFFEELSSGIILMKDEFHFEAPFGVLGHFFNRMVLTNYMRKFLVERNEVIKAYAESEAWKTVLDETLEMYYAE